LPSSTFLHRQDYLVGAFRQMAAKGVAFGDLVATLGPDEKAVMEKVLL
jgi:hypothetical protein